jgi:hypothetical protein
LGWSQELLAGRQKFILFPAMKAACSIVLAIAGVLPLSLAAQPTHAGADFGVR